MKNIIKNMPIAVSGTLLAILSLGVLLNNEYIRVLTFLLGLIIIIILLLKLIMYTDLVIDELNSPIVLSTSGTFTMALMLLSTYIVNINYYLTIFVWILGVVLHLLLIIYYSYKYFIKDFNIENFYGSIYIVYIGITMAAISGGVLEIQYLSWIFLVTGFILMIPTIILVSYRYLKYPVKLDANKPLMCIYTAIFNILIVGYFNSVKNVNMLFVLALFIIASCLYIFSLYKLTEFIQLKFYPSFSAFTFPFVISAIASTKILTISPNNIVLNFITIIETLIAIILVCYVIYQYIINIFKTD